MSDFAAAEPLVYSIWDSKRELHGGVLRDLGRYRGKLNGAKLGLGEGDQKSGCALGFR